MIIRHCDCCSRNSGPGDRDPVTQVDVKVMDPLKGLSIVSYRPDLCSKCVDALTTVITTFLVGRRK
jgi:hypothetical protein